MNRAATTARSAGPATATGRADDFWLAVFGNLRPVEIEIGPGTGTFLLAAAAERPRTNFFAIENSRSRAEALLALLAKRDLPNARVLHGDAACIVANLLPPRSVAAYHVYFPDPWWKRRHYRRRLFTAAFARDLARTLVPGGSLRLATDVDDVFALMHATLAECPAFVRRPAESAAESAPPYPLTSFERKGLARGAAIHRAVYVKSAAVPAAAESGARSAAPITPAESPS